MVECVGGYGCLTCFVPLFSGPTVVSPLSLDLYYCCIRHFCCTAVIHGGWVDRFVGVTVVLCFAVLLSVGEYIASLLLCVPVVCPRLLLFFFSFFLFSFSFRYTGPALA